MNFTYRFYTPEDFEVALNALVLSDVQYVRDDDNMELHSDSADLGNELIALGVVGYEIDGHGVHEDDSRDAAPEFLPGEEMDGDFDSAMASAGYGTAEDYGDFGGGMENEF